MAALFPRGRVMVCASMAIAALLNACGDAPTPPVSIGRLDRAISAMADSSASLPDDMTAAADAWLYITRGITPGSLPHPTRDSLLRAGRDSRAFAVFAPDVERLLPPLREAEATLGLIDSLPTRIYGMVSPYSQSVAMVDTVVIVALNHYLGSDYEGYASFPDHLRRLKSAERLPLDVGEAWIRACHPFPDSVAAPTLLQLMAYEGTVLACLADQLHIADGEQLMGWTPEEWSEAVAHEKEAWHRIVARELLFSDDEVVALRMIDPAPASVDVSPDAPGRLGRFIGLKIIRASGRDPASILASGAYLDRTIAAPYARAQAD